MKTYTNILFAFLAVFVMGCTDYQAEIDENREKHWKAIDESLDLNRDPYDYLSGPPAHFLQYILIIMQQ